MEVGVESQLIRRWHRRPGGVQFSAFVWLRLHAFDKSLQIKSTTSKNQEHTMKKYLSISIASMLGLNAPMKMKFKSSIRAACHSFGGAVCAGAVMLIASGALAQNLFVGDSVNNGNGPGNGTIYDFTPGGARSTFAVGLSIPAGLAFNSAGDLFESDYGSGNIYEFTPGGARSVFASGLNDPSGLAFNSLGDLFEADYGSDLIYEFTPGGVQSTFASGPGFGAAGLAFNSAGDLFVANGGGDGIIYEFTPGGARSTFASGLDFPMGLAFNSAGDLFESDYGSGNIYEFTPGGAQSTFASGLDFPRGLACNSAGDLFEADVGTGGIFEFTPGGAKSFFGGGYTPTSLAFQGEALPVPEPSVFGLVAVGVTAFLVRHRKLK
jgi:sugar lactone lactonase YvrE